MFANIYTNRKNIDVKEHTKALRKIIIDLVNTNDYTRIYEHLRRNVKLSDNNFNTIGRTNVMNYLRKKFASDVYYACPIKFLGIDYDGMIDKIGTYMSFSEHKIINERPDSIGLYRDYNCDFVDFTLDDNGNIDNIHIFNIPFIKYKNDINNINEYELIY